jgi:hypothetical protein
LLFVNFGSKGTKKIVSNHLIMNTLADH